MRQPKDNAGKLLARIERAAKRKHATREILQAIATHPGPVWYGKPVAVALAIHRANLRRDADTIERLIARLRVVMKA